MQQAVQNTPARWSATDRLGADRADRGRDRDAPEEARAHGEACRASGPARCRSRWSRSSTAPRCARKWSATPLQKRFDDAVKEPELRVAGYPRIEPVQAPQGARRRSSSAPPSRSIPRSTLGDVSHARRRAPGDARWATPRSTRRSRSCASSARPTTTSSARGADGDLVTIDFDGLIDGEPFEGGKASNFTVVLGEGRMLPEFEAALVGMKAGEQKTFPLTFPARLPRARSGGQDRRLRRHREPGRRAASCRRSTPNSPSRWAWRTATSRRMRARCATNVETRGRQARRRRAVKEQVMEALHDAATFEVPRALVEIGDPAHAAAGASTDLKQRGMTHRGAAAAAATCSPTAPSAASSSA